MFAPFEFEVRERLRPGTAHELAVVVEPAPETEPQTGRTSRVRIHKSRMTYGWDFCSRIIHQGIWQPVSLEIAGHVRITSVWARPRLSADHRSARVPVHVELDVAAPGRVTVSAELAGRSAAGTFELGAGRESVALELDVPDPPLWWPNGHGPSPVSQVVVRATGADAVTDELAVPVGFRTVELAPNAGGDPSARPYTFVVNG